MRRWLVGAVTLILAASVAPAHAAADPNDPYLSYQWGFHRIHTADAWDHARGTGVTIAVVDSGVDASHPDLRSKVDLDGAADFVERNGLEPTSDPDDEHGHGTHVAGTAAAASDNGTGIAGIAPGARILPVRVLNSEGSGSSFGIASGIIWAADHDADVINLSLGSQSLPVDPLGLMEAAVTYAVAKGVVVVGAAHNQNDPFCHSPSFLNPGIICVGATTRVDSRASFSNHGARLDVVAPGQSILSTLPDDRYAFWSGTSMAAPHVSGVAALLVEMRATAPEVGVILRATAEDLGPDGYDLDFGWGLIDARAAVALCAMICTG